MLTVFVAVDRRKTVLDFAKACVAECSFGLHKTVIIEPLVRRPTATKTVHLITRTFSKAHIPDIENIAKKPFLSATDLPAATRYQPDD